MSSSVASHLSVIGTLRSTLFGRSARALSFSLSVVALVGCANTQAPNDSNVGGAADAHVAPAHAPAAQCAQLSGGEREDCERHGLAQEPAPPAQAEAEEKQRELDAQTGGEVEAEVDAASAPPRRDSARIRQASQDGTAAKAAEQADRKQSPPETESEEAVDTLGQP